MTDMTRILSEIEQGDPAAVERLLPLVHDELRKLACDVLAAEAFVKPGEFEGFAELGERDRLTYTMSELTRGLPRRLRR